MQDPMETFQIEGNEELVTLNKQQTFTELLVLNQIYKKITNYGFHSWLKKIE